MVNKHGQKKKKTFRSYGKSNKELHALIEKIFVKKRRTTEKENQHFQELLISDDEVQKSVSSVAESVESDVI